MSDFLFSRQRNCSADLARLLTDCLGHVAPNVDQRDGDWGSLAVVRGRHDSPPLLEDDEHLSILVGNPVVRAKDYTTRPARSAEGRARLHTLYAPSRLPNGKAGRCESRPGQPPRTAPS